MGKELVVLRHLKTPDNVNRRFGSGDRDCPILPGQKIKREILAEIQNMGKYILAHTGLIRSKQTCLLLQKALGYSRRRLVFPEFKERIGGDLAGLSFAEIQQFFPQLKKPCQLWSIDAPQQGLESTEHFLLRIEAGIERVRQVEEPMVLVAHAGSIKGIRAVLTSKYLEERRQIMCSPTPQATEVFHFKLKGG